MSALVDVLMSLLSAFESHVKQEVSRETRYHLCGILMAFAGATLALAGLGFLTTAIFAALIPPLGLPVAALITGGILLVAALLVALAAAWRSNNRS